MKKPLKIAIIALAVLIVAVVAASLFVKSYLTEERMRALVSEMARESLNRKVLLGEIKVSLFREIIVKDFEVREKESEALFFRTREFVLKYQLLPLLARKLVIDQLSIADVEIHVKTNPDGTYNFSDMAKGDGLQGRNDGKEQAAGLPVNLNVKGITIKNAKLVYADKAGKLQKANVIVNAELGITGLSKKALSSEGSFNAIVTEAMLKEGSKILRNLKMDVRYKMDLDLDSRRIAVHSINADILGIPVNIQGSIDYASGTAYSLEMTVPDHNLSRIGEEIRSAFLPEGMALGGNVSVLLNIDKKPGKESSPDFRGNVKMTMVSCSYQGMKPTLDGSLKLTPETITLEGLKLVAGRNRADVSGRVKHYREHPDVSIAIKSKSLDLDELFVPTPPSPESQEAGKIDENEKARVPAKGDDMKKEPGPMNVNLNINASLDIDQTRYKGIKITNFRSRCELKDNVLRIPHLNGNTLSGAFALKGSVDLTQKGTRYSLTADLNGVGIEEIVDAFAPKVKGKLAGTLSGRAELTGAGTLPENAKRSLKGKGAFTIKDGALKNSELSAGLLAILGLHELREIPIDKANGQFTISDGVVNLTTVIGSREMVIDETGTVGMDEKLDLGIRVKVSERLAPKLVSQSSIARFLSDEKGWTSVPLRVEGTISRPAYGIDTGAVGRKVMEGVQKKIEEELLRIFQRN